MLFRHIFYKYNVLTWYACFSHCARSHVVGKNVNFLNLSVSVCSAFTGLVVSRKDSQKIVDVWQIVVIVICVTHTRTTGSSATAVATTPASNGKI